MLLLFFVFVFFFWPRGMSDLSSRTRDQTHTLYTESFKYLGFFFNFLFCIGVQAINNVPIGSGEHHWKGLSHTYTYIHSSQVPWSLIKEKWREKKCFPWKKQLASSHHSGLCSPPWGTCPDYSAWLPLPGRSDGKESACNAGDLSSIPGLERSPGKGNDYPTPVFLPGEPRGQRSLVGYSSWVAKSQTRLIMHEPLPVTLFQHPALQSSKNVLPPKIMRLTVLCLPHKWATPWRKEAYLFYSLINSQPLEKCWIHSRCSINTLLN